jgi:Tfp pilus assembly protein PilO
MSASTKRFYSLIGSIALLVGAIIIYSSMLLPLFNNVQNLRGEVSGNQSLLQQLTAINENVNKLQGQYQNMGQLQQTISSILPPQDDVPTIINQIQGLASANNIQLSSISFQYLPINYPPAGSLIKGVGAVAINLQCSGTYQSLISFLNSLSNNIQIFDLSSLSVSAAAAAQPGTAAAKGQAAAPVLSYSLTINTYYQSSATSTPSNQ